MNLIKVIIAGGRNYQLTETHFKWLDTIHKETPIGEVVSGGAKGADEGGEIWAKRNNIPVNVFHADWNVNGRAAGPIRNEQMAKYCAETSFAANLCILFPGGKGTQNMKQTANFYCIPVKEFV